MSVCGSSLENARHWIGLLAEEPRARPLQVPVGLVGPVRLRVEDDEPRVDAAAAERLHVRPADPGQVDRAMGDAELHGAEVSSAGGEEEPDPVPAGDLTAVGADESRRSPACPGTCPARRRSAGRRRSRCRRRSSAAGRMDRRAARGCCRPARHPAAFRRAGSGASTPWSAGLLGAGRDRDLERGRARRDVSSAELLAALPAAGQRRAPPGRGRRPSWPTEPLSAGAGHSPRAGTASGRRGRRRRRSRRDPSSVTISVIRCGGVSSKSARSAGAQLRRGGRFDRRQLHDLAGDDDRRARGRPQPLRGRSSRSCCRASRRGRRCRLRAGRASRRRAPRAHPRPRPGRRSGLRRGAPRRTRDPRRSAPRRCRSPGREACAAAPRERSRMPSG